jgi:putative MFS transporter
LTSASAEPWSEVPAVPSPAPPIASEDAAAALITRMEQVPTSRWFVRARVVMGSATFFDAFNALSVAFVLPILVPLWHITAPEVGIMIGASYVGQVGALLVPLLGWQIMFLIGGIPGLAIALMLLRLPESPRWLIGKGRLAEAEAVVMRLEAASDKAGAPTREALPAMALPAQVPVPQRERGRWSELLSPAYRGRTLIAWVLWACAFLIANSLNNWMPTLYTTVYHLGLPQALRAASMTNVAQVLLVLVCAMVIDRTGRKYWMMGAFGLGAVMLGVLAFGGTQDVSWVIVFSTLSYGLIGSVAAVVYLYTPEIYPTRMRAIGTGVATSWLRIASAVGPTLIGFMLGRGGVDSVFLMFAGVAVVGLLAATRMIETRNLRLEQIAR